MNMTEKSGPHQGSLIVAVFRTWAASVSILILTSLAGVMMFSIGRGSAHVQSSYGWVAFGNDEVLNYDRRSASHSATEDWPVSMVFYNNAEIDKVKGILDNPFDVAGGAKYLQLNDNGSWYWDADSGRKKFNCLPTPGVDGWTEHYRPYADSDDRMWDAQWGYYIAATAHWDKDDPDWVGGHCDDRKHGWTMLATYSILSNNWSNQGDIGWANIQMYSFEDHNDYPGGIQHAHFFPGEATSVFVK